MSVKLHSKTENVLLARSWYNGECKIFVSMPRIDEIDLTDQFFTSLALTREQALTLGGDLLAFAHNLENVDYKDES